MFLPAPAAPSTSSFLAPFPAVLEQVPVMAWMTGTSGRCIFTNRSWLAFTGHTAEQELGFGWTAAVHAEDRDRSVQAYLRAHEARTPFRAEYRLQRRDGSYRVMEASGVPVYDPGGDFHGRGRGIRYGRRRAEDPRCRHRPLQPARRDREGCAAAGRSGEPGHAGPSAAARHRPAAGRLT